jgi:hypothetical protein
LTTPPLIRSQEEGRINGSELWRHYVCDFDNLHKGPNIAGVDPITREVTRLYNPRRDRWRDHFAWLGGTVIGLTPIGRTKIHVLAMNDPEQVAVREALIVEGRFPPR